MTSYSRTWIAGFGYALRGVKDTVRSQKSFVVELVAAVTVLGAAAAFGISAVEWCIVVICIGTVLAAEALNSAIEALARAVTSEHDENIRTALDIAAGAVLLIAIAAAVAGTIVFLPHLLRALGAAEVL